jgi:hypothetical protein
MLIAANGVGSGRLWHTLAAIAGWVGVVIGGLAIAGSRRAGNRRAGPIVAGVLGLTSLVVGGLHPEPWPGRQGISGDKLEGNPCLWLASAT